MNNIKPKISKEKRKYKEGGIPVVCRLTNLSFLPKFWVLDIQALNRFYYKWLILS